MQAHSIYSDIKKRTGGDIYIGVVGPVRTGKSTFIHKFLDNIVLPNIENEYDRKRTEDEIPQSSGGRTVMTTEPKFVPDESVKIKVSDGTELNVKLIDCVGYMVDGALGDEENGETRMIMTPWSKTAMPFREAAELGTSKVIGEHSTIGMLVTQDGSIGEIPRENYISSEERVVKELRSLGKPFAIVLNSKNPNSEEAVNLAHSLEEKYSAPVALVNCLELNGDDIREILGLVLGEFPISCLTFKTPDWCEVLDDEHPLKKEFINTVNNFSDNIEKLGDVATALTETDKVILKKLDAGDGCGEFEIPISSEVYYNTLSQMCGMKIENEKELFETVKDFSSIKKKYEKVSKALEDVENTGYGIVMPSTEEMTLDEPVTVKSGNGYGVKVTANANSIHMVKASVRTDLCPVVGTEEQALGVVKNLTEEFEENPEKVWDSNMFGSSLYELVIEGINSKLSHLGEESREKLRQTLERVVNEGSNGLICILL